MTKASSQQSVKVFYKGETEDFIIWGTTPDAINQWKKNSTVPLVDVVEIFKVFVTHRHGAQGVMDSASKSQMENEFGTSDTDEVIKRILKEGTLQTDSKVMDRADQFSNKK